jgi:acetyl esterase
MDCSGFVDILVVSFGRRTTMNTAIDHRSTAPRSSLGVRALERVIDSFALAGARQPGARPEVYGVEAERNISYGSLPEQKLDIYRPERTSGPMPVVLYVHGGGFRLLSKDTHWMMAVAFARRGYLVLNIDYRLAKRHPFPAALEDVSQAWMWALDHVEALGGDPQRIVVAGESAGANLVTSLAIQTSYRREELWARRVYEAGVQPAAVVGLAGIYEVSDIDRLLTGRGYPAAVRRWVEGIEESYLPAAVRSQVPTELADPLRILERGAQPDQPLPPFFLSVGSADPLLLDSRRLHWALIQQGVPSELEVYEGEGHAFQMMTWRRHAKASWAATFDFLRREAPQAGPVERKPDPGASLGARISHRVRSRALEIMAA